MDYDGTLIVTLILIIILKSYFTACEHSIIEVKDAKVKELADKNPEYRELLAIIKKPLKILSTFATFRALSTVIISIISFMVFNDDFTSIFSRNMNETISIILSSILSIIITVIGLVALTDTLPKRLVEKNPEKFALSCTGAIKLLNIILTPLSSLTYGVGFIICKIFGVSTSKQKEIVTEEEIKMLVEAGNETGVIKESQRTMINNIFEFGDSVVSEVMTHRTDLIAIDINSKIGDIIYLAINEGFSRIPIYEETVDSIIGIIYVKDLLCLVGCEHSEDFKIHQFIRTTMYVPETSKCREVFEAMSLKKSQVAVVVDEYGGTAGMVTMEDLLEEIVGNIQDEYDDEEADFSEIAKGVFMINGHLDPEDIINKLGINLPEGHNYDTMSAFIVDILGRIPNEAETPSITYQNVTFTVLLIEDNWISKIKAIVKENITEQT